MESAGKIILVFLSFLIISCVSSTPLAMLEIKPLPREVVIEHQAEYEPIYATMKVLEISEENGVQKYLFAKVEGEVSEITAGVVGEISGDLSFDKILGNFKVISRNGNFIRCSIETLTHKVPANSYIRIQIGKKKKE